MSLGCLALVPICISTGWSTSDTSNVKLYSSLSPLHLVANSMRHILLETEMSVFERLQLLCISLHNEMWMCLLFDIDFVLMDHSVFDHYTKYFLILTCEQVFIIS